ncbi:MAG TPA: M28 family peptidase [Gemmatimonadaceae bacterium]
MIGRIRSALALGALLAVGQAAAAQRSESPVAVKRYFDMVRREFSAKNAYDQVAFMDRYFRWPGNTGFDASLDRVEGILKAAGYVNEASAPGTAPLTYRVERRKMNAPAWDPVDASVVVGRDTILRWATNRNMLAINSFSTPDSGVVASIVDVGKGTPADYDKASVAGKIVLVEASVGRAFGDAVQRRGAIGVLGYSMPAYTQPERNRTSIQFGSIAYDSVKRAWGIALSRDALERLRAALAKGQSQARVRVVSKMFNADERTIVAEVHGSQAPSERFVLSAHVQEPGANDNASGVGDLSEMARVLGVLVRDRGFRPKRTITMLFGLEIAQTRNYLAADSARTRGVRWGLSLDMTGEDTRKTGGTFLIEKMPDPSAVWTRGEEKHSEWGGRPLEKSRIVPHYFNDFLLARCLDQAANTGWVVKTNPFEGGSDHTPFLDAKKPGVLFWHFTDMYYHTDGDRIDKVSVPELENVGLAALVSVLTLTSADGQTARDLVGEVERAAVKRLDTETALSATALKQGSPAATEDDILSTWTDYYVRSLKAMEDIEVGGASAETRAAIDAASRRVAAAGADRLRSLKP